MPEQVTKFRIFVASPGDVSDERSRSARVVEELSRTFGDDEGFVLELIRWETHAWPGFGDDAQDVINQEIRAYDVFVGILWRRLGTPTQRAASGTAEEFARAYERWEKHRMPLLMFYFSRAPFSPTADDLGQLQAVMAFKDMVAAKGGLYWEYDGADEFEALLRQHLYRQIRKLLASYRPEHGAAAAGRWSTGRQSPRPSVSEFPVPDAPTEDVLEGIVDAVNIGAYGLTLGEGYLLVSTPTAPRQWGGYYKLTGIASGQWFALEDRRGFTLPIAIQRETDALIHVRVDSAVLRSSLPPLSSLPGY